MEEFYILSTSLIPGDQLGGKFVDSIDILGDIILTRRGDDVGEAVEEVRRSFDSALTVKFPEANAVMDVRFEVDARSWVASCVGYGTVVCCKFSP